MWQKIVGSVQQPQNNNKNHALFTGLIQKLAFKGAWTSIRSNKQLSQSLIYNLTMLLFQRYMYYNIKYLEKIQYFIWEIQTTNVSISPICILHCTYNHNMLFDIINLAKNIWLQKLKLNISLFCILYCVKIIRLACDWKCTGSYKQGKIILKESVQHTKLSMSLIWKQLL